MRDACRHVLVREGFRIDEAADGNEAIELLERKAFDVVLLDLKMPGPNGMDVLGWIGQHASGTAVVVITGHATVDSAVEAMKKGATDYLAKPFTPKALTHSVHRILHDRCLARDNLLLREELDTVLGERLLVGRSEPIREIHELVRRVGPTDSTVLLTGESGTGKEVVARTIHTHSLRKDRPIVVVDCGALVGTLFESELFGHVKGSFTGATSTKHGRLELADGATIFFDEIGNVEPQIQAKLLRVIQEREITRVGDSRSIPVDVRIIAATSRNLTDEIRAGRFREDLYYRLCVVPIVLPPLRQRKEDIPLLAEHFLNKYNQKCKKSCTRLSDEALEILVRHSWPGNVRELENTIERAVVLTRDSVIHVKDLMWLGVAVQDELSGPTRLRDVEREYICRVLEECGGNRTAAAKALGIDRKTLWRKLRNT
ncbi:MAG: sigma-54-dependent Fis family transcriptional regulator [Deltaproteobacteria bacterium]|nr:sigma-54-dependent Fis family transcriptional regulator [Deltaproteobacteria bacterium]